MPLFSKFCLGQGDEFLPSDFLRDLSSRLMKLVVVWRFSLLLGTTAMMARLELQRKSYVLGLSGFCSKPLGSCKMGEMYKDSCGTNFVERHLLPGSTGPASTKSKA